LYPDATKPDTATNRVNAILARGHGYLTSVTSLTGDCFQLHHSAENLGNLKLKKAAQ
jgi:hypothetical protein